MLCTLFAEIGTPSGSEMEEATQQSRDHDGGPRLPPGDVDGLTGAEALLDQPDEDTMEHSGLRRELAGQLEAEPPSRVPTASSSAPEPKTPRIDTVDGEPSGSGASGARGSSSQSDYRTDNVGGKYMAIRKYREEKLACPDLIGGYSNSDINKNYGSFRNISDYRIDIVHESNDIAAMRNRSYSFDLQNYSCMSCSSSHQVLHGLSGAGAGGGDEREVLVLSDQNFPAALPSGTSGKKCLSMMRIEFASLSELADAFLKLASSATFSPGGVIVISSASHLARVGTAAYCGDLVRIRGRILDFLGNGYHVAPGPFLMGGGTNDRALIQSMAEVYRWLLDLPE